MDAILIHGMGRTPAAMSILAVRLWASGIRPHLFGYSVTFEKWDACLRRYENFIVRHVQTMDYIIVGHSLGTVLTRAVLPRLTHIPKACFFLAPPTCVPKAARIFSRQRLVRLFMGDVGKVLTDEQFMGSLPLPAIPTRIYAGVAGPRGVTSPFGAELNDGLLALHETRLPGVPLQTVPALHPFIMNSSLVTRDIIRVASAG